ncbi:MAG: hypothetical protein DI535_28170 [Citrobacter freundii]|nr:MAG: hypothetical protein DI535_28170 [Citrobacter freundii]
MRLKLSALFLAVTAMLLACSKEDDNFSQPGTVISLQSTIGLKNSNSATLRFDEVVSDSRCPANALCAWAGIAIAKFTLKEGREEVPFMLSLMPGYPKQDTIINGFHIEFFDLKPYPGLSTEITGQQKVEAEMKIHRLK